MPHVLGVVNGDWDVVRWPDGDWWGDLGVGIELGCDAMRCEEGLWLRWVE